MERFAQRCRQLIRTVWPDAYLSTLVSGLPFEICSTPLKMEAQILGSPLTWASFVHRAY